MNNKNICKFPLSTIPTELKVICFVWETNETVMKNKISLSSNRIILIEEGCGNFVINNTPYSFESGSIFFVFEKDSIYLEQGNSVRYFYIDFLGSRAEILFNRFGINESNRLFKNYTALIPFFKEHLLSSSQESIDITAESALLCVFARLSASYTKEDGILQKVLEFTKENFSKNELTLALVSKELGYNAKYLSHFFKKKMNRSYSEYLRSLRFQYAISLFESGLTSIKNVSFLSGFSDPLYFSNAFKKEIGVSPKEFISNITNRSL